MNKHEFTGRTTEEAISEGLRKLGCTISDVKVEVLDEGAKGLFGLFGSKMARVVLTLDEGDDDGFSSLSGLSLDSFMDREEKVAKPKQQKPQQTERPPQAEKPRESRPQQPPKADKPRNDAPRAESGEKPDRPEKATRQSAPRSGPKPAQERRPAASEPRAPLAPSFRPVPLEEGATPLQHDVQTPSGCAQAFLQEATRLMNVPVVVDVQTDPEGNLFVQMVGDTLGILIGRRGETLDALQYLTSLQVNKGRDEYIRVTLDTENYRAKREDSLCRLAARMATRAYKTGRKVALEPMNPYERRILHASLQDHPYVVTHSEGEEPNRHVVITLKPDAAAARRNTPRQED